MEKVSSILAEFRLSFAQDENQHESNKKRAQLTARDKGQKAILLVDSLLQCAQQQIDQFLAPTLDSLLRLATDETSRDVRQAASDALNRLVGYLPENLLTKLRYLLFKHLQHAVNQPTKSIPRLKVIFIFYFFDKK